MSHSSSELLLFDSEVVYWHPLTGILATMVGRGGFVEIARLSPPLCPSTESIACDLPRYVTVTGSRLKVPRSEVLLW